MLFIDAYCLIILKNRCSLFPDFSDAVPQGGWVRSEILEVARD